EVDPGLLFAGRVAQEISRMEGRHDPHPFPLKPLSPNPGDPRLRIEDRPRRRGTQGDDQLRPDQFKLLPEDDDARLHLLHRGSPVPRRPALDDIGDINLLPGDLRRLQHLVQQLPRAADEGAAHPILVGPRPLSHEHQRGAGISLSENETGPPLVQRTTGTTGVLFLQLLQRHSAHHTRAVGFLKRGVLPALPRLHERESGPRSAGYRSQRPPFSSFYQRTSDEKREDALHFVGSENWGGIEVIVRKALPADASGIARVHVDSWRTTYRGIIPDSVLDNLSVEKRENHWKQDLRQGKNWTFVAENTEGEIVGFACSGPERTQAYGYDGEL